MSSFSNINKSALYVNWIGPNVTESDLYELFTKYGKIKKLSIVKTFAFITYYNNEDAENAKYKLDNYLLDNKNIKIDYAVSSCYYCGDKSHDSKDCPEKDSSNKPSTKCYFCKGEWHPRRECPEKDKDRKHLEKKEWNKQTKSRSRSRDSYRGSRNRSRSRSRSHSRNMSNRDRSRDRDRDHFKSNGNGRKNMFDEKMYLKFIGPNVTEDTLYQLFGKFGNIRKVKVYTEKYAFVEYYKHNDAEDAKNEMDDYLLDGKRLKISYSIGKCYFCGDRSHDSKQCTNKDFANGKKCCICKGEWHPRKDCPEKNKERSSDNFSENGNDYNNDDGNRMNSENNNAEEEGEVDENAKCKCKELEYQLDILKLQKEILIKTLTKNSIPVPNL